MRNLKKILALVLALVMSLSLMATASAADFKDVSDISENYQTAVNVLSRLEVFKGYAEDDTFRPQGDITRAEVATIIYRIVTGDVKDAQAAIYTDMTTSFADLNMAEWARGYVNFCHNAQIIKGESATKFNPNGKITGYATLAMILRAMGYGRNGEFEGTGWEYQTAATAKSIGLIDNVMEGQLGSNAPREMVAEILFRALLTEMVDYTVLNGYVPNGKTLGYEQFGLESVTGVVMANEWANLNNDADGDEVLADGKTEMLLADGTTYMLDISSDLEVVGLTCTAYMADQDKNGVREVLTDKLEADAVNVVADNEGKAIATGNADQYKTSIQKLADTVSITINSNTEYYWDYDWNYYTDSDILIRYAVEKGTAWIDNYADEIFKGDWGTGHRVEERIVSVDLDKNGTIENDEKLPCWVISITPNTFIYDEDIRIMRNIFYTADRLAYITDNNLALNDYLYGEVYVGTASTTDVSDSLNWKEFTDKYLTGDNNYQWTSVANGESLRIVDNNGDGKAEYVLGVGYTQDKVIGIRDDVPEFYTMRPATQGFSGIVWDGGVETYEVGTIVNYRLIDNKLTVWTAPVVTDSIKTKSFQKITVTTTDSGETYGQSGIWNYTLLDDQIMSMDDDVKYNMYLDQFGFIRTYELAQGYEYALLTEMYSGVNQNTNYLSNPIAMAEVTIGDETDEYVVNNGASSVFLSRVGDSTATSGVSTAIAWTLGTGLATGRQNYLQPAIAHLLYQGSVWGGNVTANNYTVWNRLVYKPATVTINGIAQTRMFDYGEEEGSIGETDNSYSFTNVAAYALKDDGTINLKTASTWATDQNGRYYWYYLPTMDKVTSATWDDAKYGKTFAQAEAANELAHVYSVDYVQLTKDAVAPNQRHFNIEPGTAANGNKDSYNAKYQTNSNGYVNATVNTEFYIVTANTIKHVTSYANLPAIKADNIRAAYAVAKNTNVDSNGADYWVADVIVIETKAVEQDYDSISLFYWNPSETQSQVRYIDTLNNEWNKYESNNYAKMQVIPGGSWGNFSNWAGGYGFYELYGTEFNADANSLTTASVKKIGAGEYNDHGIYAGALRRENVIADTSGYVSVNIKGERTTPSTSAADIVAVNLDTLGGNAYSAPIYHVQYNQYNQTVASEIRLVRATWNDVDDGDQLIWVVDAKKNTAFVVDLAQHTTNGRNERPTPQWLWTIYSEIIAEQGTPSINTTDNFVIDVEVRGLTEAQQAAAGIKHPANILVPKISKISDVIDADNAAIWNFPTITGYAAPAVTFEDTKGNATANIDEDATLSFVTPAADGRLEATESGTMVVTYAPNAQTVSDGTITTDVVVTAKDSAGTATISAPGTLNTKTGESVTLEVDVSAVAMTGKTLAVSVAGINGGKALTPTKVDGTVYTYTFTVPAAAAATDYDVTATVAATTYAASIVKTTGVSSFTVSGAGWSAGTPTVTTLPGTVTWGSDLEITPTFENGYEYASAKVTVGGQEISSASGANWAWDPATGKLTIKDSGECTGKAIQVEFTSKLIEYTLTFTTPVTYTGTVYVGTSANMGEQYDVSSIASMTVTKNTVLYVTAQGAAAPTTSIDDSSNGSSASFAKTPAVSGADGYTFTISGICTTNAGGETAVVITFAD